MDICGNVTAGPMNGEEYTMLELLQFVFSSFWIFVGTVILLGVGGNFTVEIVRTIVRMIVGRRTP